MIQLKLSESEVEVLQRSERNAYDGNEAIRCRLQTKLLIFLIDTLRQYVVRSVGIVKVG